MYDLFLSRIFISLFFLIAVMFPSTAAEGILLNSNLETDNDHDQWPDGWARVNPGGSWVEEGGNHFLRLESTKPGELVMLYQEIKIPDSVEALELRWKQRVSGLVIGKQSWFDARILLEFMDGDRKKMAPSPNAPSTRKDTDGWIEKHIQFLVPNGAKLLKFMPSLFQVQSGEFELDDIELRSVDPMPIRELIDAETAKQNAKRIANENTRRAKAATVLASTGNLLTNGDFEAHKKSNDWPDDWGRVKEGGQWPEEDNNHFLRLSSPSPGKMIMAYRTIDLPKEVGALELSWKQRVTGLKKGTSPWFDARIMLEFMGNDGKKLTKNPSAPYTQKDTDGWQQKNAQFLVPEGALTLVLMPSLFQVQAGTFDIDDVSIQPTDTAALIKIAEQREREIAERFVPPEAPNRAQWPSPLRVVGNRLHDINGKVVWLQGVNAGGLETLPQDKQPIKSTVVAIEKWKSNCVRLPIKDEFWFGRSPYQKDGGQDYRNTIEQIVTLAANRGVYVVIDLHRFRAPKTEHADFWKDFSKVYKDHPAVLFDLFNEPHGITWDIWKNGGFVAEQQGADESAFLSKDEVKKNQGFESIGMQGLVDAVRSTGAKNVLIAGGLFWCNDLSAITHGYALDDPTGNGIMYSWHTYNWHTDWEAKVLATAQKHPVFLGEVGADIHKMDFIPASDQEDPYTWVPDMLGFIQKHQLNWTGWCLHPKATPILISDWSYTPTPYWGDFAKRALSGEKFELKRTR